MSEIRHVSAAVARRFLALRHLLAPPRSLPSERESVLRVIDRIGSLQFDPLEVAGRNHDLVLLARIQGYRREWTDHWLYEDRRLYETYNKSLQIVPVAELPLYRYIWDREQRRHEAEAFDDHAPLVDELIGRIRDQGVLLARDVKARQAIDWYWRPTNQVRAILEALAEVGTLGIARREGNIRVYDLAERLFPPEILADRRPEAEQQAHRLLSRFRAHGLLGASGNQELWVGGTGYAADRAAVRATLMEEGRLLPVHVEGIRGERFVVAEDLAFLDRAELEIRDGTAPGGAGQEGALPGVAFLAPLDPLCWDRDLLRRLFGFDYIWEVYVPEPKRRWGYYVLPILFGDRLVGRIEPRLERRAQTLRIVDMWWEPGFEPLDEPGFVAALADALLAHRDFGGLATVTLPRTGRHRPLATAIRAALSIRDAGPRKAAVGRCSARRRPSPKIGSGPRTKPTLKEAIDG
ncbi:MAG TPA: crosslink repair DNA glycosylase YcaQ family protein [Candidatus Limnocylindria bacterium]|nr:crosslink repair DNA glycosylase YcaQ family protein [Candidatus Limnocylindria bacterium]